MKFGKIVKMVEEVKRKHGDKDVKAVVIKEERIDIVFESGFILSVE